MWKTIKVRNPFGWIEREAMVSGIWAAHEMLGVPEDRSATWSVTHRPSGMCLDIGPLTSREATAVAVHLGRHVRHHAVGKLVADRWLIRSLAGEAIAAAASEAA